MENSKQQKMSMFICTVCRKQFSSDTWRMRHMERSHPFKHQKVIHGALNFRSNQLPHNQPTNPKKFKQHSERHSVSDIDHHKDQQLFQFDQIESELSDPLNPQEVFSTSIQASNSIPKSETYKNAGLPIFYVPTLEEVEAQQCCKNPWYPFTSATEFRLAEILTTRGAGQALIDDLLKDDSGIELSVKQSIKLSYFL
jgi:hypothetical protein